MLMGLGLMAAALLIVIFGAAIIAMIMVAIACLADFFDRKFSSSYDPIYVLGN